jgi:chemotaxis protein CheX
MNTDLHGSFLDATKNVFKLMLDIEASPADEFACDEELDIAIGVTGDLTGEIVYRFPQNTSLNIVNIMAGMEVDSVDEFVTSAVSEIANIISGNVLMTLADKNLNCDITPPELKKAEASVPVGEDFSVCINTSAGAVCLDIRLRQA